MKKNCWEIKNCGREPGGHNIASLGPCPAALDASYHGINGGKNAGRFCWTVAGTFCGGYVQGIFAMRIDNCLNCKFFGEIEKEELSKFVLHAEETSFPSK